MLTKEQWVKKWKNCSACDLHKNANHHVLMRGTVPASCLIIGEAPGKTEDKLGKPFIGPSGQLLTVALQRLSVASYCIANVVCCIPLQEDLTDRLKGTSREDSGLTAIRPPSKEEAAACSPHLSELVSLCNPKLICLLGNEAEKYFDKALAPNTKIVKLRHPAYVLRRGGVNSVEFKRFLKDFQEALALADVAHYNCFNQSVQEV